MEQMHYPLQYMRELYVAWNYQSPNILHNPSKENVQ